MHLIHGMYVPIFFTSSSLFSLWGKEDIDVQSRDATALENHAAGS